MDINELAVMCKRDKGNIEALWLAVYRLIILWAKRYCKKATNHYSLDDLCQSGYFAILKAVEAYQEGCGHKFTTYLYYHCRNEFNKVLGVRTRKSNPRIISLDTPLSADDSMSLSDTIPDEEAAAQLENVIDSVYNEQLNNALNEALQTLPDINRQVIDMLFYKGLTRKDTAEKLNLDSYEKVRKIECEALRALQRGKAYALLKDFDYYSYGIRGTGFLSFKHNMESSTEAAVIEKIELEQRYK